jgi:heat shock protein HtpX
MVSAEVYELCTRAGLKKMPEIAIYQSNDKNAFATGRSKNKSLIAVSTGLLYGMSEEAVEAVIAHEVAHIMNGDMVTQTLLQSSLRMIIGVIILPITLYRLVALFVSDNENIFVYYIILFFEFLVSTIMLFISSLFIKSFSRKREFKADYLAAQLTTPENMILALKELDGPAKLLKTQKKYAAIQFNGMGRFLDIFSTHPSIKRRIKYLEKKFIEA